MSPALGLKRRVAIVAGGNTGLLLAQGLAKRGYPVTVYDKDQNVSSRNRDWTMSVHWSLLHLSKILPTSISKKMSAAYTDPFYLYENNSVPPISFFNGPTGDVQIAIPAPNLRRLSRERFRKVLTQGMDIRWGKRLTNVQLGMKEGEPPVMLSFDDGSRAEADLLIGADGTNSRVRRWLLGDEAGAAKPSSWSMCNGSVRYGEAGKALLRKAHPLCSLAFTEHGLALCAIQNAPDPSKPETWSFNVLRFIETSLPRPLFGKPALALIKSIPDKICEPFWSAINWIPPHASFFATQLDYWVTRPWNSHGGRLTLAGDAAHAMLPSRGQGMNHALEDVGRFVDMLDYVEHGGEWASALRVYEEDVWERGRSAVERSLEDARANTMVAKLEEARLVTKGLMR